MKPLEVITDSMITKMATKPEYLKAFPFLKNVASVKVRRRCCGGSNRTDVSETAIRTARMLMAQLSEAGKATLKTLLRARRIRVVYSNGRGQSLTVTF